MEEVPEAPNVKCHKCSYLPAYCLVGAWTNPSEKYDCQNGFIFPNFRGENPKCGKLLQSPSWGCCLLKMTEGSLTVCNDEVPHVWPNRGPHYLHWLSPGTRNDNLPWKPCNGSRIILIFQQPVIIVICWFQFGYSSKFPSIPQHICIPVFPHVTIPQVSWGMEYDIGNITMSSRKT